MFRFGYETFALTHDKFHQFIIWYPCHVTMGLFEAINMTKVAMATYVKELISSYNLLDKLIAFVKDESGNLSILA
jgi:hypothetical protein